MLFRSVELWWAPALVRPEQAGLAQEMRASGVAVTAVSRPVFEKVAYRQSPDGWLAVAGVPGGPLDAVALPPEALVLVGQGIEKPGNLGAMVRTAEALGVDAVVAASAVTDFGNPNAVRASKGTVFAVPLAAGDDGDVLGWARRRGLQLVVTSPRGTTTLTDADLTRPTALVVGAESTGVPQRWLDEADLTVEIPMHGHVNSLNAATAAALVLYEARRQRSGSPRSSAVGSGE